MVRRTYPQRRTAAAAVLATACATVLAQAPAAPARAPAHPPGQPHAPSAAAAHPRDGDGGDNGVARLSAAEISRRARAALLGARSLHLGLADPGGGEATAMDLALDRQGDCAGTVTMGPDGTVQLVKRGAEVWMKPDTAFWKSQLPGPGGSEAARLFGNRYLHGTTDDTLLKGLTGACDLDALRGRVSGGRTGDAGSLHKGAPTTLRGTDVVPLTASRAGTTTTLYVATRGTPYPVEVVEKGGGSDLTITLSDFDEPVPSATPAAAESVDIARLEEHLRRT